MSTAKSTELKLTIGRLAQLAGVPAKTIRYYEEVGLLPEPERTPGGYRVYDEDSVHVVRFAGRARQLGFSMEDLETLLELWSNKRRRSSQVRAIAARHIDSIDARIADLGAVRETLAHLVHACHGDDRPDCPILDELSNQD